MRDIKNYDTYTKIEFVNKGWSSDKKYYVETADGRKLLLRVADISEYDRKKTEFERMQQVALLGVTMSQPLEFGTCNHETSVYTLHTWCEGEDAEIVLPFLTETEQYTLGIKYGEILRMIHQVPAPKLQEEWGSRFNNKTSKKIEKYRACGVKIDGDETLIDFIENNRHLLFGRPQCYQHGDYHVGNLIISPDHTLSIIDFNRQDFGDPWEEFNRIVWSASVSPHFATGQINGYFGGTPPIEFFELLAFYISSNTLSSIYWAISFGEDEITTMKNQARDVLTWFNHMKNPIPTWYLDKFYMRM